MLDKQEDVYKAMLKDLLLVLIF
ncbi:SusD/RagB family nutrient-binding outer membrane lipoprotein [Bacteroides sp. BFG-637]|nr:SusD/RagB family nutrient-binding outer membrane lipoprotein [Bacteroides sp. BFG-637]